MRIPRILRNSFERYSLIRDGEKKQEKKNKRIENKNHSGHPRSLERELAERAS